MWERASGGGAGGGGEGERREMTPVGEESQRRVGFPPKSQVSSDGSKCPELLPW